MRTLIGMYRDDTEALLARADALEIEVEQLRARLARKDTDETIRPVMATRVVDPHIPDPPRPVLAVRSDDRPRAISPLDDIVSAEEQLRADVLRDRIFFALKSLPMPALERVLDLIATFER